MALSHFQEFAQDDRGNKLAEASILVQRYDGASVTIYYDRLGTQPIVGSVVTSAVNGYFHFYAASGYYKATVSKAGYETTVLNDLVLPWVDEKLTAAYFGIQEGAEDQNITSGLQSWIYEIIEHSSGVVASGKVRCGIIEMPYGNFVSNSLIWHPAVSIWSPNRAGCKLKLLSGATPVGVDNVRALVYLIARTQEIQATGAWNPMFQNIRLSGNKANQDGQYCYGIYCEKGENDPNYEDYLAGGTELKSYGAALIENTEIEGFSGTGLKASGDRQRLTMYGRSRSINHGLMSGDTVITDANGVHILGNDPVISDCGFGGCTGHSVLAAGCSGVLMRGNNCWGTTSAARSREALAMHLQNTNGACIVANTFNDTVSIFGGDPNNDRAFTFVGNHLKPNKAVFSADGVPVGTGDEACNAFIRVRGNRNAVITGNDYSSASNGNRYKWLASFTDEAVGSIEFMASTEIADEGELLIRPWQTDTPVPLFISGNSAATFVHHDAWRDMHRFSGSVVIDMNNNNEPEVDEDGKPVYGLTVAGTRPALMGTRVHYERGGSLLPAKAQSFENIDNEDVFTINEARARIYFYSDSHLPTATFVMPSAPDDGHELELVYRNGVRLPVFQMPVTHGFFLDEGDEITTIPPGTTLHFTFKYDDLEANEGKWWVTSPRNRGLEPYGHKFQAMTNGGSDTMLSGYNRVIHLTKATTCTAFTLNLPDTPFEGETRRARVHQAVTTWALAPAAGQVLNATDAWPTTIPAGGFTIECTYHVTSTPENVWYLTQASA